MSKDALHKDLDRAALHFVHAAHEEAKRIAAKHGDPGLADFIIWGLLMKAGRQAAALMGQVDYMFALMADPKAREQDKMMEANFERIRQQEDEEDKKDRLQ